MKNSLLERLDSFTSAPFTVQRICELLTFPRKQYNRIDKFMRAIEKNILVVSTREPGHQRQPEPENGERIVNGSDNNSEYNVDVEMEDMSWKDSSASKQSSEPQPGSSDAHISVDDIEARLQAKQETSMDTQEKVITQYESLTPPELNVTENTVESVQSPTEPVQEIASTSDDAKNNNSSSEPPESKEDIEMKGDTPNQSIVIPEIKVEDVEMTEQKVIEQTNISKNAEKQENIQKKSEQAPPETTQITVEGNSSHSDKSEELKQTPELSSSEESSSSSDNTDGNSNSPKTDEHIDVQEESQSNEKIESPENIDTKKIESENTETPIENDVPLSKIESENYSISDVQSELPKITVDVDSKSEEPENTTDTNTSTTTTTTDTNTTTITTDTNTTTITSTNTNTTTTTTTPTTTISITNSASNISAVEIEKEVCKTETSPDTES
ncbi:serine/threonine-protein phosphatase 4 regulatory subunit 2-like [Melitaea cinxia]|uniref:serine/threonine-protein phosphatase 4 regulatory subunit 2-like n=1 Tax=Melitaea cinxia TaxID=113334 RepID=UPI001E274160|nr:serine/threonine-protein phosphatase 4 regulatory subunit 2-like [Melitaea cinxia]